MSSKERSPHFDLDLERYGYWPIRYWPATDEIMPIDHPQEGRTRLITLLDFNKEFVDCVKTEFLAVLLRKGEVPQ